MLIDDVEQLKDWLTSSLAPICEADPSALAKYVVALVKKDKTLQDLKDSCVDQLDVFLQTKTKGFVETLFEALDSKAYITKPIKKEEVVTSETTVPDSVVDVPIPPEEVDTVPSSSDQQVVSSTSKVDVKKEEDILQKAFPIVEKRPKSKSRSVSPRTRSRDDDRRRRLDDRPFFDRRYPRRRSPSPRVRRFRSRSPVRRRSPFRPIRRSRSPGPRGAGRGRSRSRSWSRSRSRSLPRRSLSRSRSRERVRSRSPGGRFKSRSPRREVRARSPRGRSPYRRSISPRFRSRSPRKRSRSPLGSQSPKSLSPKRSRSGSPIRKVRRNSPDSRGPTPTQENGMVDSTNPTPSHSSISVVSGGRYNEESASRLRCRDYDEKGFCVRGDLCMYDHGNDPVVVESVPQYPPGPPVSGMPHPPGPPPPPGHPLHMGLPPPGFFANRMPGPPIHVRPDFPQEPYNPEAPGIRRHGQPPYWPGMPDGLPPFMKDQPPPMSAANPLPVKSRLGNRGDLVTVTVKQERKEPQDDDDEIPSSSTRTVIAPKEEAALSVTVAQPPPPGVAVPDTMHRPPGPPQHGNFSQQNRFHPYQRFQHGPRKPFDYNRIGGYRRPDQTNCSLEVRKIPPELNNIAKINEHFGKFGNLTNIQVKYEGDAEAALVTFTNNQEALSCYKCSEPVFNNRFVKVFWHQKNKENGNQEASSVSTTTQSQEDPGTSARSRLSTIPPASKMQLNNNLTKKPVEQPTVIPTSDSVTTTSAPTQQSVAYTSSLGGVSKTVYNPTAHSVAAAAAVVAAKARATAAYNSPTAVKAADFVSRMEKVKQIEAMKKEAALKKLEIQKHKQELLEKHIEQQKKLIATLEEKKDMKESSKKALMETLKTLSNSIDRMKSELGGHNLTVTIDSSANITPGMKSPEQAKKEILDVELELMTKSTNGEETAELQKKLNELTKVANSMGILGRGRGRGTVARGRGATTWVAGGGAVPPPFGRGRGRGRGAAFGKATVATRTLDRRPKIVEVTGFDVEEKEEITSHLNALKDVEKVDFNMDIPCAIVSFKTRKDAEMGILYGSKFKSKTLKMIWHIPKPDFSRSISAASIDSDQQEEIDEEALLAGEDEEEDDNEERSWRP